MLQPAAEADFQIELNAKLKGKGNPLPFRMEGIRGVGKTSQGLIYISERMQERGWKVETAPRAEKELLKSRVLSWLGKLCQENTPTVILWDEADSFPWEALKELISSNGKSVEFPFNDGEEKSVAVYNPNMFLWLLASNFSVDNGERGAGDSRTHAVPFLPYNEKDKLTLWERFAAQLEMAISPECLAFLSLNSLPIGRDLEKQALALRSIKLEVGELNLSDKGHVREAMLYRGYYPRGLQKDHIDVLRFLATAPLKRNGESYGYTLSDIRSHALKGRDESEIVSSLSGAGMIIRTPGTKQALADKGGEYLEMLDAWEAENGESLERVKLPLDEWRKHFLPPPVKAPKGKAPKAPKGKGGKAK